MLGALMPTNLWARLHALLSRPLFGTKVIPRDARVDPAEFPEDEFPVYCPKCHYLLRGLPDGRCPECGDPFDRGRLLITQYAFNWQIHPELRSLKYVTVAFTVGLGIYWIGTAKLIQWYWEATMQSSVGDFETVSRRVVWLVIARFVLFTLGLLLMMWLYRRSKAGVAERAIKRKRRQVIDAYFRDRPCESGAAAPTDAARGA